MIVRIRSIIGIVSLILIFGVLYFHYQNIGVMENLFGFLLVTFFGVTLIYWSVHKWADLLNPVSFYFFFIFGFAYSLLNLSSLIKPYTSLSLGVIVCSMISFIAGALVNISFKSPFRSFALNPKSNLLIYYAILIISVCSFGYEIIQIGYLPVLKMFSFDVYNDANKRLVSFIHYFAMLFSVFPAWTYILYKRDLLKKKWMITIAVFSFFVILNYLSRQVILLFFLSLLVTISFYHVINVKKVFLYGAGGLLLFFLIGNVRLSQDNAIKKYTGNTPAKFLRTAAGIKYNTNVVESTYVLYSSFRYNAFNEFVKQAHDDDYYGFGRFVFRPLVSLFFLDRLGVIKYDEKYNTLSEIATYAIDPYLDFGILGVIFIGFMYGLISKHFYENYKSGKEQYIVAWSIIIFCIIMSPFMNFFGSFFVLFVWGINKLITAQKNDFGLYPNI